MFIVKGALIIYMVSTEKIVIRGKKQGKRQSPLLQQRAVIDQVLGMVCDSLKTVHVCLGLQSIARSHILWLIYL